MKTPKIMTELESRGLVPWPNGQNSIRYDCLQCNAKQLFIYYLNKKGGYYKCMSCEIKGHLYDFLIKFCGYSPSGAKEECRLANDPEFNLQQLLEPFKKSVRYKVIDRVRWNNQALKFHRGSKRAIKNSPKAINWLQRHYQITPKTIKKIGLGYNPEPIFIDAIESWGLQTIKGSKPGPARICLAQGIVIPRYYNVKKGIAGIRFKDFKLGPYGGYNPLEGSKDNPLRLGKKHSEYAIVLEKDLDGILLHQELPDVYVIALGTLKIKLKKGISELLNSKTVITISDYSYNLPHLSNPVNINRPGNWHSIGEGFINGFNINNWFQKAVESIENKSKHSLKNPWEPIGDCE
jgi:hypothetical protein